MEERLGAITANALEEWLGSITADALVGFTR